MQFMPLSLTVNRAEGIYQVKLFSVYCDQMEFHLLKTGWENSRFVFELWSHSWDLMY